MIRSRNHHYIPQFYLRRWEGDDSKIFVHSRDRLNNIVFKKNTSRNFVYDKNLNRLSGVGGSTKYDLESRYFGSLDNSGAQLLRDMELTKLETFMARNFDRRVSFAKIFGSLRLRHPVEIDMLEKQVSDGVFGNSLKLTKNFEDYLKISSEDYVLNPRLKALNYVFNSIEAPFGPVQVASMRWGLIELRYTHLEFLCSDQPVVKNSHIGMSDAAIALPLGPRKLFFATSNSEILNRISGMNESNIVKMINYSIVRSAYIFVCSSKCGQETFIKKHFDLAPKDSVYRHMHRNSDLSKFLREKYDIQ